MEILRRGQAICPILCLFARVPSAISGYQTWGLTAGVCSCAQTAVQEAGKPARRQTKGNVGKDVHFCSHCQIQNWHSWIITTGSCRKEIPWKHNRERHWPNPSAFHLSPLFLKPQREEHSNRLSEVSRWLRYRRWKAGTHRSCPHIRIETPVWDRINYFLDFLSPRWSKICALVSCLSLPLKITLRFGHGAKILLP